MIRLTPILVAVAIAFAMYWFSAKRSTKALDRQSRPLTDPILLHQINALASELNVTKIPVRIYDVDMINGLAAADGRVYLTRGFIDQYRLGKVTADELVAVVAHEIGHVALGHSRRRMIDFASTSALRTILMVVIGRFIPFVGIYIANAIAQMVGARLSRKDEFEADAYAAALLTKSGIGVGPQISLFRKLEKLTGGGAQGPAWFMSHPKADERIAAIQRLSNAWQSAHND